MFSTIATVWETTDSTMRAAIFSSIATVIAGIFTIIAAIGASILAWIGVRQQLSHDRGERARDRSLETRRSVMLEGVAGLSESAQAIGLLVAPDVEPAEARKMFMAALAKITKSSAVSSLSSARAGRIYTEVVGAFFVAVNSNRAFLDLEKRDYASQEWSELSLKCVHLQNSEILPLLQITLAAAREDLDMSESNTDSFMAAIAPDWRFAQLKLDSIWEQLPLGKVMPSPQILPSSRE